MSVYSCTTSTCTRQEAITSAEKFREVMNFSPYHFWQWGDDKLVPPMSNCNGIVLERGLGGTDNAGRHELRHSLYVVEEQLRTILGYSPVEREMSEEIRFNDIPHVAGGQQPIQLGTKKLKALGRWVWSEVGEYAVAYQDLNGDGLLDAFSVTVPAADHSVLVGDLGGVEIWPTDDDWPFYRNEELEGRTIKPTVARLLPNGDLEIRGRSWTMMKPVLQDIQVVPVHTRLQTPSLLAVDPTVMDNYLEAVVVRQRTIDPSGAVRVSRRANVACGCSSGEVPCGWATSENLVVNGCAYCADGIACARDYENGLITVRLDFRSGHCCRQCIEGLHIEYIAGEDCDMSQYIARLAAAELGREICGCKNREMSHWSEDLKVLNREPGLDILYDKIFENPLGTSRAAEWCWRTLRRKRKMRILTI